MNAADRAFSILRAGLRKPPEPAPRARPQAWTLSKCAFARYLDDQPFPANPPPSLIAEPARCRKGKKSTHYGQWLHDNNPPEFNRLYQQWKAEQEAQP